MRRLKREFWLLIAVAFYATTVFAADHREAPPIRDHGHVDIADVYAFQSPDDPNNTVLILTVNPFAGAVDPAVFDTRTRYRFLIDNDGDAHEDVILSASFIGSDRHSAQQVRWRISGGDGVDVATGKIGETIELRGGGRLLADVFDDPFFFDFQAFLDQIESERGARKFCDEDTEDFFSFSNVNAIVVELPSARLTGDTSVIRVWATSRHTTPQPNDRDLRDRMGIPLLNTALIPDGRKNAYNHGHPARDRRKWWRVVADALMEISSRDDSGYTRKQAATIAHLALPDVLTLDTKSPAGFVPNYNGRRVEDDVVDLLLYVGSGGLFGETAFVTTDCVDGNESPLPGTFPYLAPPHANPRG